MWLTSTLQEKAVQYGCSHRFDKEPKVVFHTTPGSEEEVRAVYSAIHRGIIFVHNDSVFHKIFQGITSNILL